jgi:hypothetical protein
MAASTILYVGDDICHRIPVMRTACHLVFQSEDSVPAIRKAFAGGEAFSAITFNADISAPSEDVVQAARSLSAARLVLFENPSIYCDTSAFDIVISSFIDPSSWLKMLHDAIQASREQRELSLQLRQECATVRSNFLGAHAVSARVCVNPIDLDALWLGVQDDPSTKH